MRHEIKLVILVFLLVVGPAVGLSFLTGRILGNWQVILQKRMETAAAKALETADAEWTARLDRIRRDVQEGVSARAPVRLSAAQAAANPWVAGVFLFQGGRGLVYPAAEDPAAFSPPREDRGGLLPAAPPHGPALLTTATNRASLLAEYRQIVEQPNLPPDAACRVGLQLAHLYRAAGQIDACRRRLAAVAGFPREAGTPEQARPSGEAGGAAPGMARDPEEGFFYDLIALDMLADVCAEAGDREGVRRVDLELMRRALERYDTLAGLQKERLFAHLDRSDLVIARAAGGKAPLSSEEQALVDQWRAWRRGCGLTREARARLEQEFGRALQSGLLSSNGWMRVGAGGADILLTIVPVALAGGWPTIAGLELDGTALQAAVAETIVPLCGGAGLSIRHEVVDATGRRTAAYRREDGNREPPPLLAERRLSGALDRYILSAYPADPQAFLANARLQERLYGWGGLVLIVSVVLGGWLIWREAAREIQRARERSEFAAAVSHDLRTPLSSMRMLAESLHLGRIEDPDKRRRFLEIILKESDRLSRLTDRALYFIQYGQGALRYRMTEGDIAALVKDVVETFATGIEGKVRERRVEERAAPAPAPEVPAPDLARAAEWQIGLTLSHDLPSVRFDAGAMEQVVFNLLDNAMKYSRGRREIEVDVRSGPGDRHVVVAIRDFGVGIEKKDLGRIFKAYHRGKGSANTVGLGLGLALCRDIVRAHRGRIEVDSVVEQGSLFRVILPAT